MLYTARGSLVTAPHGEWPGIEIAAMEDTGHGWVDRGVMTRSPRQNWRSWDEVQANRLLVTMGWRRTDQWISRGGRWWAHVERF